MSHNNVTPLEVPTQLLRMPLIKNKDILEKKYEYDKVGLNQNVIVDPSIVKFSGFETGKLNVLKVKVINKNAQPQRIYILPPKSDFFNVKFDKKGAIPSGMAEELYVHFKPIEYKYYYDTIRINTQNDTLLIPIHAFPALSRDNLRDLFPRLIDFGTIDIGEQQTYRYPIQCKIPLNFEFEFTIIKDHSDIHINPMKDIIPGKGVIEIEIQYKPTMNVTAVMEAELKISQYDFEPLAIKIMGSGRYQQEQKQKMTKRPQSTKKLKSIINHPKSSASKRDYQNSQDNLDEASLQDQPAQVIYETEGQAQDEMKSLIRSTTQVKTLKKAIKKDKEIVEFKIPAGMALQGRQALEKVYLDHFNQVANLDKEKEIRFFQCIGDPQIKQENINSILQERDFYWQEKLKELEQKGITRYKLELDNDSAIADQILPKYECQWDFDKNDTLKIKKIKLRKCVFGVTKVIYRIRFDNRIQKIRAFLKGAKTRQEVQKLVNQDWQKAEFAGVGKKDFIQFTFEFEENCIGKFTLPVQYQETNAFSQFKFDINPRTGFDDWATIEQIPNCDQEIMQYKNWDYPQLVFHPPLLQSLNFRDGAEEEKSLRGKMGPINSLISTTDESIEHIRNLMQKPPEVESYQILQPHKTLKHYQKMQDLNPIESYYNLGFSRVSCGIGADLDPDIQIDHLILKQEFMNRTPGYQNLNLMYELNLEQYHYQEKNMQLAYDVGFDERVEQYCPELLADKEIDDHLTDDDSDGEGPPQMNVQEVDEFLRKIEQDDKNLQQYKNTIIDAQEELINKINGNLQFEKTKWIATVPSKTSDYNKFISNNVNKMVII